MKYIDAEKLIHDLEERIFAYSEGYAEGDDNRKDAIETLLNDVKHQLSLQRERPEVDLEKYIENEINHHGLSLYEASYGTFSASQINGIIRDAFELGLNARKEE